MSRIELGILNQIGNGESNHIGKGEYLENNDTHDDSRVGKMEFLLAGL